MQSRCFADLLAQSRRDGRLCARDAFGSWLRNREHAGRGGTERLRRGGRDSRGLARELHRATKVQVAAASVRLKKRAPSAPDGFYRAIAPRHTNRYAYERSKAAPGDWLEFLRQTGDDQGARVILFDEGEDRRAFDAAVVEATQAIIDDKTMIADSDRWFRSSPADIEAHRDGPTVGAAGLSFFSLSYARLCSVSPETSHSAWLRNIRDVQLVSAPLTCFTAVRDRYDRKATLAADASGRGCT